jgi:hypothetical protein
MRRLSHSHYNIDTKSIIKKGDRRGRGRDRMVVGFTTNVASSNRVWATQIQVNQDNSASV